MPIQSKPFTSHSFIAAQVNGVSGQCTVNVSTISDGRIPYFVDFDVKNKACSSLDILFTPIGKSSGTIHVTGSMPCCTIDTASDTSQMRLIDRFDYGISATDSGKIRNVGNTLPLFGAGYGYDVTGKIVPSEYAITVSSGSLANGVSGNLQITSANHYMTLRDYIGITDSTVPSYNGSFKVVAIPDSSTFVVATQYSGQSNITYSPITNPYPSNRNGVSNIVNKQTNVTSWKAGPVDLRWDNTRQLWCGSDFFRNDIVRGYLSSDITPALGRNRFTTFTIQTYKINNIPTYVSSINGSTPTADDPTSYVKFTVDMNGALFIEGQTITLENDPNFSNNYSIQSVNGSVITTFTEFTGVANNSAKAWILPQVGSENTTFWRTDETFTVRNYDTHLSVDLNSNCDETNGSCLPSENDIFVVALRYSQTGLIPIYIGFGDEQT